MIYRKNDIPDDLLRYFVRAELGLESTPELYVERMVDVFREVRRVLRNDGVLFLNVGDSYWNGGNKTTGGCSPKSTLGGGGGRYRNGSKAEAMFNASGGQRVAACDISDKAFRKDNHDLANLQVSHHLKPKDLIGIPWMLAFALRADGWYLRSEIIWAKPNPMPESVTDRPTKSHEQIFLLAKSGSYFYDADAIAETVAASTLDDSRQYDPEYEAPRLDRGFHDSASKSGGILKAKRIEGALVRNRRTVWSVTTVGYSGAHFATFPPKLIEPCILAGTSPQACENCGAPWERVTDSKRIRRDEFEKGDPRYRPHRYNGEYEDINGRGDAGYRESITTGWRPSCDCENEGAARCVVLDPFFGAGTTGVVASRLNRDCIGLELNPEYVKMAEHRIHSDSPLFNQPEVA